MILTACDIYLLLHNFSVLLKGGFSMKFSEKIRMVIVFMSAVNV